MLKALIYSSILIAQLSTAPPRAAADCNLKAEASVTNSSAGQENGAIEINASGGAGKLKYFFCDEGGTVLNEKQINSNKIEKLKKGTYYCIVAADRCTTKLKIVID